MDQIWLASPSPALRLWLGTGGATWRLNPAAMAWGRARQLNTTSWRDIASTLAEAVAGVPEREGRLDAPACRWRSLPMSTGWLVWLLPGTEPADGAVPTRAAELLELVRAHGNVGLFERDLTAGG